MKYKVVITREDSKDLDSKFLETLEPTQKNDFSNSNGKEFNDKKSAIKAFLELIIHAKDLLAANNDKKNKSKGGLKDTAKDVAKKKVKDFAMNRIVRGVFSKTNDKLGIDDLIRDFTNSTKYNENYQFQYNSKAPYKTTIYLIEETDDNNFVSRLVFFSTAWCYNPKNNEMVAFYSEDNKKDKSFDRILSESESGKKLRELAIQNRWIIDPRSENSISTHLAQEETNNQSQPSNNPQPLRTDTSDLYKFANMILEAYKTNYFIDVLWDKDNNPSLPPTTFEKLPDALKYALSKARVNKKTRKGHINKSRCIIALSALNAENEPWRVLDSDYNLSKPCKDFSDCWDKVEDNIKNKKYCIMVNAKKSEIDKCKLKN